MARYFNWAKSIFIYDLNRFLRIKIDCLRVYRQNPLLADFLTANSLIHIGKIGKKNAYFLVNNRHFSLQI